MHDVIAMPVNGLVLFLLVAARVLGALATGPLFAFAGTPAAVRAGAGLAIALVLAPVVPASPPTELHLNLLVVVQEVVLGVLLGTLASLMVSALQMAAGLIDFQAGFSLGASIDSFSGHQVMPVERFYAARKSPLRLARLLGPAVFLRFVTGRLSVADVERRFRQLAGCAGRAIVCPDPEVGMDVDKPEDCRVVEGHLAAP